jgi:hypothetical protein
MEVCLVDEHIRRRSKKLVARVLCTPVLHNLGGCWTIHQYRNSVTLKMDAVRFPESSEQLHIAKCTEDRLL